MKIQLLDNGYYIRQSGNLLDELPNGDYMLVDEENPHFAIMPTVTIDKQKIYGDVLDNAKLLCESYLRTNENLGALLSGVKGSGKSLTAQVVSATLPLPVINVSAGFDLKVLTKVLSQLDQRAIVVLDEFEKNYKDNQDDILTLLSGVHKSNKLFLIIVNDITKISEFLINRLGRLRYHFRYKTCSKDLIEEVIEDTFDNKDLKSDLVDVLEIIGEITLDNLLHFIKEVNETGISPYQLANVLNFTPEDAIFDFLVVTDGKRGNGTIYYHPFSKPKLNAWYSYEENKRTHWAEVEFDTKTCVRYREGDRLVLEKPTGEKIKFTKRTPYEFNFKNQ
jgi:hypothetical protein